MALSGDAHGLVQLSQGQETAWLTGAVQNEKKSEKTNMKHKEEKFFNYCKFNEKDLEKDLVSGQTQ